MCNETYFCFGSYHVRFLYISVFANIEIIEIEIRHGKDINKNRQHDIFFCVFLKKNDLTYIISDLYVDYGNNVLNKEWKVQTFFRSRQVLQRK